LKREEFNREDIISMVMFLYDSIWKLIIIFEEVLGVKCKICKRKKRELTYPYFDRESLMDSSNEKQYEIELIKMIKEIKD
jgi:hypothetical protein